MTPPVPHAITGPIVENTANELDHDLGGGLAAPHAVDVALSVAAMPAAPGNDVMMRRIEALEAMTAKQDRVFRRVLDLLSAVADR